MPELYRMHLRKIRSIAGVFTELKVFEDYVFARFGPAL
jgi:hypothetical protein